jgi:rhodanese-related sulfurtransferase
VFAFGELADGMAAFLSSTDWGRVTLDQTFGVPVWVAVLGSIGFGLFLFTMMNSLKTVFWKDDDPGRIAVAGRRLHPAVLLIPAGALLVPIAWFGLPDADEAYALRADTYEPLLEAREVHVDPAELLKYLHDDSVVVQIVDVRDESSYNLFHLRDALHVPLDGLDRIWTQDDKPNRIVVLISNDEAAATVAWRRLTAMKVANVYVLDGGVNGWLDAFGAASVVGSLAPEQRPGDDTLCHDFDAALGDRHHAALPSHHELEHYLEHHEFEPRVKLVTAARKGGGCG